MRTTLDIDDRLLIRAKTAAVRRRTSLTRFIEDGLRLQIKKSETPAHRTFKLPVSKSGGGLRPGIDPCSNASMEDAADGLT